MINKIPSGAKKHRKSVLCQFFISSRCTVELHKVFHLSQSSKSLEKMKKRNHFLTGTLLCI